MSSDLIPTTYRQKETQRGERTSETQQKAMLSDAHVGLFTRPAANLGQKIPRDVIS